MIVLNIERRIEITNFIRIDDFEEFVRQCYPNLSQYKVRTSFRDFYPEGVLDKHSEEKIISFNKDVQIHYTALIFEKLVKDGFLEKGTYILKDKI